MPEQGPPMAKSVVEPPSFHRIIERDVGKGAVTIRAEENEGRAVIAVGRMPRASESMVSVTVIVAAVIAAVMLLCW